MVNELHIAPNRPVYVALVDPEGVYDSDLNRGTYQTTAGQTLILPRPAVIALNMVGPAPQEEIEILQSWTGKTGDRPEWSIRLSDRSEQARCEEYMPQDAAPAPGPAEGIPQPIKAPTPIRRSTKEENQPGLFELGTGTRGPAPSRRPRSALEVIPGNIAFREVSAWVAAELKANNLQWSDQAQQAMVCTVMIAEYKAGRIGPWEREK